MIDTAGTFAVLELNGANWRQWFLRMENFPYIHKLWEETRDEVIFKKNGDGAVEKEENPDYGKMQRARCYIINYVNLESSEQITRCEAPNKVWTMAFK